MQQELGIAIIGTGRAGMIHARNFAKSVPNAKVAAMVDPVKEQLDQACSQLGVNNAYDDYRAALDDKSVHAVVIASPTKYHKDIAIAAAHAGKHILCEKPMAMDLDECDAIIQATRKNNVKFQIGFMRRFDKSFSAAKERIDQGEIGDVVMVRSLTYGPSIPKPWMYDISKSNGPLAEVNSHDIDTLRWYTAGEFKEVHAIAGNFRCPDAKKDFPDFYDNVIMNASFNNGRQGSISGAQGVQYGYDSRCEILGTKGIIFVGALDGCAMLACSPNGMSKPIVKSWMNLFEDAYLAEDKDFIESILQDRQPQVSGLDGKMAVAVVNAGNQSIQQGKPVTLDVPKAS